MAKMSTAGTYSARGIPPPSFEFEMA
jgi:hypothetical protein